MSEPSCTPTLCPHCHAWETVPGKVRCERKGTYPGPGWFSTSLGATGMCKVKTLKGDDE